MVERAARAAGFDMKIHPHMLRHSCGYKLATTASIRAPSKAI
jgi:site-specific recombinase XerD